MKRSDLLLVPIFFLLSVVLLWPVTLGGQTLIPADNLFAFPPWRSFAAQFHATVPHNELLSDLLLENYAWKKFIVESLQQGQVPLWNPYLFTGVPFLAAGQHSALYPFSILFYLFPLEYAYGWFVAIQLGIAGLAMFIFGRTLGLGRTGSLISAFTYEFSGFFLVSIVFPMVISAACWLPLLLACEERIIKRWLVGSLDGLMVGWIALGALVLGVSFLAGHIEIAYYNLIVMAFYALWRITNQLTNQPPNHLKWLVGNVVSLSVMVILGLALAAVQLIPLFELVSRSFRQGSVDYNTVVGYAFPIRQIITFFIPDFFGNPSHHAYFDLFARQFVPVTQDAAGHPINNIFWGVKNYVEAGSYVGILPLLLAMIAVAGALSHFTLGQAQGRLFHPSTPQTTLSGQAVSRFTLHSSRFTLLFTSLAVLSLLFIFGTPLYAILFYGLPGFSQLHSPFRWVYPYTLSVAVLAGIGVQVLVDGTKREIRGNKGKLGEIFSANFLLAFTWLPFWTGVLILATLALSLVFPSAFLSMAEKILHSSDLAQHAFPDARAFYSYEAINLAKFALFLLSAGAIVRISRCPIYLPVRQTAKISFPALRHREVSSPSPVGAPQRTLSDGGGSGWGWAIPVWKPLAVLIMLCDLFVFGYGFYPSTDPQLLQFTPPAVKFMQADPSLFRVASLDAPGDKTLNPNVGMLYGLQDIRGYDSIIPKQYADWMNRIEGQGELLYNRIAPFYWHGSLDSRLLDLANVKYVLTTQEIPNTAKFTKVYAGEINIYRNERVLPRAFLVLYARAMSDPRARAHELKSVNPLVEVLLDGLEWATDLPLCPEAVVALLYPSVTKYTANEVVLEASPECDAWLVLADAYFEGWQAFDKVGDAPERETKIYLADGNFRAVRLSAGNHVIRFKYNPLSFRVGLYLSFFAAMALVLMGGYWAWGKLYRAEVHEREARRVLKNSALPMATSLLNKVIDTVFAAFMLRVLGPENAGKFYFATLIIIYCDIFINFGLNTLVTREVSRDRQLANRFFSNTTVLRLILLVVLTPLILLFLWLWRSVFALSDDTTFAIILLAVGLIPSGISSALSSIFFANELMEYPAAVTVITTLLRVTIGTVVLLAGFGFVGLAGANIFINLMTLSILLYLFVKKFFVPRLEFDPHFVRSMAGHSYPLMLNDLLQRAFNRVDTLMLQPLKGDTVVGWYSTAYKYLDGLNILPSTFTIALFPVFSRYAAGAPDALMRAYLKSMKYLIIIAMPLMVLSFVYADFIILLFGGSQYLPDSAIALRLIIGFLPLSFINNVSHYVLIAVNQQRYLTKAFIVGAMFNIVANLIFIPMFSYRASALITIFSELVLLIPFYIGIRRHVGAVNWIGLLWRPAVATLIMSLVIFLISAWSFALLIPIGLIVYLGALVGIGTFNDDDREMIGLLIPARLMKDREIRGN